MWLLWDFEYTIFPEPVFLNRLAAPRLVLIFGMVINSLSVTFLRIHQNISIHRPSFIKIDGASSSYFRVSAGIKFGVISVYFILAETLTLAPLRNLFQRSHYRSRFYIC